MQECPLWWRLLPGKKNGSTPLKTSSESPRFSFHRMCQSWSSRQQPSIRIRTSCRKNSTSSKSAHAHNPCFLLRVCLSARAPRACSEPAKLQVLRLILVKPMCNGHNERLKPVVQGERGGRPRDGMMQRSKQGTSNTMFTLKLHRSVETAVCRPSALYR